MGCYKLCLFGGLVYLWLVCFLLCLGVVGLGVGFRGVFDCVSEAGCMFLGGDSMLGV